LLPSLSSLLSASLPSDFVLSLTCFFLFLVWSLLTFRACVLALTSFSVCSLLVVSLLDLSSFLSFFLLVLWFLPSRFAAWLLRPSVLSARLSSLCCVGVSLFSARRRLAFLAVQWWRHIFARRLLGRVSLFARSYFLRLGCGIRLGDQVCTVRLVFRFFLVLSLAVLYFRWCGLIPWCCFVGCWSFPFLSAVRACTHVVSFLLVSVFVSCYLLVWPRCSRYSFRRACVASSAISHVVFCALNAALPWLRVRTLHMLESRGIVTCLLCRVLCASGCVFGVPP